MKAELPKTENLFEFDSLYAAMYLLMDANLSAMGTPTEVESIKKSTAELIEMMESFVESKTAPQFGFARHYMFTMLLALSLFEASVKQNGVVPEDMTVEGALVGISRNRAVIKSAFEQNDAAWEIEGLI